MVIRQGVSLVSYHLTPREGFDPSINPLLCSVLCDVFKMAKQNCMQTGMKEY